MKNKFTKEMEKDVIAFFEIHRNKHEAVKKFNDKYGTNFHYRTLQQRYSNFQKGLNAGIEATATDEQLELIAKNKLQAMIEQKKNVVLRSEAHKVAREIAKKDLLVETIKQEVFKDVPKFKRIQSKKPIHRTVDLVISDAQYKGNEEEWIYNIFNKLVDRAEHLSKNDIPTEFRIVFLGDDVEAAHAHPTGQMKENNTDTITQTIQLSKLYVEGINAINNVIDKSKHVTTLVFVPYSNHGMVGGIGKERYQHPMEDLGRMIFAWIENGIDDDVFIYPANDDSFVVETGDTVYLHGHQGYVKSNRFYQIVGVDKDIMMGHLHHYEEKEENNRVVYLMPTCRKDLVDYERLAGFAPTPQVTVVIRTKDFRTVQRIYLGD